MTEAQPKIHDAEKAAYSSVVGQAIMLMNASGACIAQLSVINTSEPQRIADEVVAALKAPNRHAYKVGVAVGKSAQREAALQDMAEFDGKLLAQPDPVKDAARVPAAAVEALAAYQQADPDGVMVLVSRQAIDECLPALRAIAEQEQSE